MNFKLYLISDRKLFPNEESFLNAVEVALSAGVRAFQLREKDLSTRELYRMAKKLREITIKNDALLFINDRIDIALAVEADGVHLPQSGFPAHIVRKVWNKRFIIGVSTHSADEAKEALEWADFVTLSPIFQTTSKPQCCTPLGVEKLKEIKKTINSRVFALGGINLDNIHQVIPYCDGVAMISGILAQKNIEETIKKIKKILGDSL